MDNKDREGNIQYHGCYIMHVLSMKSLIRPYTFIFIYLAILDTINANTEYNIKYKDLTVFH